MNANKTGYPSIDRIHLEGIPEEKLNPKLFPFSMLAAFTQINAKHMEEPLLEENGKSYTKQEFRDAAVRFASSLLGAGVIGGQKIAIATHNHIESIIATFGANAIGVEVVMVETSFSLDSDANCAEIEMHRPRIMCVEGKDSTWVKAAQSKFPFIKRFIVLNPTDEETEKSYGFDSLMKFSDIVMPNIVEGEIKRFSLAENNTTAALYLKTSGSTSGIPKTLPFSNLAIISAVIFASNSTGTKTNDEQSGRALCNAPFQHGYGWMPLYANLIGGNEVVLVGGKAEDVAKYYQLNPGRIYGTPLTLKQLIKLTPEDADLSCLTKFFCAGSTLPEEEYEAGIAFFRAHNSSAEILNNYGISETMCVGTYTDGVPHKAGTIGWLYLGPEWLIVDEELNEVKYGEEGELIVASPTLCLGYFNDPRATKEAFIQKNGKTFFKTGDFAILYEDRYVRFTGRKRRFFFAEGVTDKVNCETIEMAIRGLSMVKQAAVVIKKDRDGVEFARAFVTLVDGTDSTDVIHDIRTELIKKLLPFQMPREIFVIDSMPMMASGKINYRAIENM